MPSAVTDSSGLERVFPGESAMAAHMRAFDWSTTDLGPPTTWPQTLRVALGICLAAPIPMQIWWGLARTLFYNDACLPLLEATNQHPLALGRSGREAWGEIDNQIEQVFTTGAANESADSLLVFNSDHPQQEMNVTFSFSPLLGESGAVEGVFGVGRETTTMASDSTARKKIEEALRASEAKYRVLFENTQAAVHLLRLVLDEHGEVVDLIYNDGNQADRTILRTLRGKTFDEIVGRRYTELWPPDFVTKTIERMKRLKASSGTLTEEVYSPLSDTYHLARLIEIEPDLVLVTTVDLTERRRMEEALRESEEKYRTLFNSIDQGFFIVEVIQDAAGKAVDWRHLEVNPAVARMNGLQNATGKLASEMIGKFESVWLEPYDKVLHTGEPTRIENYNHYTDRWYQANYSRMGDEGSRLVAVVFDDISERKRHEQRQAYLLKLNDALSPLEDAVSIKSVANRLLGEHLGADRVVYEEHVQKDGRDYWLVENIYHVPEYPLAEGLYPVEGFGRDSYVVLGGKTAIVNDAASDGGIAPEVKAVFRAIDVAAYVALPVVKAGRPIALFVLNQATPRVWQPHEVALLEETAERTWAMVEGARAKAVLRRSEERQAFLLKLSDALRPLGGAKEIHAMATRITMNFFDVDRCYYCEIIDDDVIVRQDAARADLPSVLGVYPLNDFPIFKAVVDAGHAFVVRDTHTTDLLDEALRQICLQLQIVSFINVPVIKAGKPTGILAITQGTPRHWTELDIQLAEETAERTWAAVERAKAEAALSASEEKYRTLFESMTEGFGIGELIRDETGKAVDWQFLELSQSLEKHTGMNPAASVNRPFGELFPGIDRSYWVAVYADVVDNKIIRTFENYWAPIDRWLAGTAMPAQNGRFNIVYEDVTERKRREAHQTLLVEISDALSRLVTPDEIMQAVGSQFGEYLQLDVCVFVDVDEARGEVTVHHGWNKAGVPSLKQTFRMVEYLTDAFARASRAGELFVVRDTATDARVDADAYARLNIGAWLGVPFHREGRWTAFLAVTNIAPRDWRDDEIELVRTIADRVFPGIERARAEAALRASEARIRIAVEAAQLATWEWQLRTGEIYWNERHFLLFGMTPQDQSMRIDDFFNHVHPDDRTWLGATLQAAIDERRVYQAEFRIRTEDGSTRWMNGYGRVMAEENGQVTQMSGVMFDITERKEVEEALRDSEVRFRAVANLVPDLLWSNDPVGVTEWYNQRWFEYTGQTLEKASAYGWLDALHPDDRANVLHNSQRAMEQGEPLRREDRIRSATGEYHWFLVQANPLKDATGKILRWFGAATDIHEQRLAREMLEQRVQERTHELEALSASRQQLLARIITAQEDERRRIAHELHDTLGQFLSALNLQLSLLQQSAQPHAGAASPAMEELGQLWRLVNEIDGELRRLTLELRPPALDDLGLGEAIRRYTAAWSQNTAIPVDIYTAGLAGERLAPAIELTLYRIVQEALTNVLKHARASAVSVILERRSQELRVIIEDNGVGFDQNALDGQAEGRRPLGLIGMRERAALVGGRVELETAPGAGTTLYVYIPLIPNKREANG
ncbi:MAG: PAS domain S-box protein [Caldilineaceae bacterium]